MASNSERRAGKVFFSVTMSLDGFIAPAGMTLEHAHDPTYKDWGNLWGALQSWVFEQRFFRDNLQLGGEGQTGEDNRLLEETYQRTGASILGKRMFEGGERFWPEEAPFHTPVFVLTHQARGPWERPGGTTFYFANDGIVSALRQAREVAGGRDIRIGGGGEVIRQYLNAGLVDEFHIALSPVFLGEGIRLFEGIDRSRVQPRLERSHVSPLVTHLRYSLKR